MLIFDKEILGEKLFLLRKKKGLTQAETAEKIGISNRVYVDIERGVSSMRLETFMKICVALNVSPNELLVQEENYELKNLRETIIKKLFTLSEKEQETALGILAVYFKSLD